MAFRFGRRSSRRQPQPSPPPPTQFQSSPPPQTQFELSPPPSPQSQFQSSPTQPQLSPPSSPQIQFQSYAPPQTQLETLLGGGKIADILLWRDVKSSAATVVGLSTVWFLLEVVGYNIVNLLCHILIAFMLILIIWKYLAKFFPRKIPAIYDFEIPESIFRFFHRQINFLIKRCYDISTGNDFKIFFMTIAALRIGSIIAKFCSTVNLLYTAFLCLATLPIIYEKYGKHLNL